MKLSNFDAVTKTNAMRRWIVLPLLTFIYLPIKAQETYKDAIKLNLSALALKNISIQYERKLSHRVAVAVNYRRIFNGGIPYSNYLSNNIKGSGIDFSKLDVSSWALTPELRLYVGRKGAMRGFYFGPFVSVGHYGTDFPIHYSSFNVDKSGVFNGSMNSITGGLQLGTQVHLSKRISLDIWIVGPNYGNGKGDLIYTGSLTFNEQSSLRDALENLKQNVPLHFIQSYTVDSNGAKVHIDGPWGGVRALGFNLSYHF